MKKTKFFEVLILILLNLSILSFLVVNLKPDWQIGSDGYFYYSYARSLLFDGDFDFYNEAYQHNLIVESEKIIIMKTPIGKTANLFSVGPSLLWSPFILFGHAYEKFKPSVNSYSLPGFNAPYQVAISLGSITYFLAGLSFLYLALKKIFSKNIAFISSSLIWLISPLVFYLVYEPSKSHAMSFFAISALFYFFIKYQKQTTQKQFLVLGFWLGLAMLIRWQNFLFIVLPLSLLWQYRLDFKRLIKSMFFLGFSAFLIFLPQFLMWKHLFGSFVSVPQGSSFFNLLHPYFKEFLFSPFHGLFIWHPLLFLATLGFFMFIWEKKMYWIFLLAFLLQIYMNSALSDWMGGGSFGARRMIGSTFIFTIGIAYIISLIVNRLKMNKIALTIFFLVSFGGLVSNLLLMFSCARGIISIEEPTAYHDLINGEAEALRIILKRN